MCGIKKPYIMNKEKKEFRVSRVLILLTLGFVIKIFFSCTPLSQSPTQITYNKISVVGVDNSGRFLSAHNELDTLYSEAVAFKLTLSDTSLLYASLLSSNIMQLFSFRTVQARSIEMTYIPKNKVVDIEVKTLFDINASIKAGDDISEYILCDRGDNFEMYYSLRQGMLWLNEIQYDKSSSIIFVLKIPVENTKAKFEVVVTLDNGNTLLCTTDLFTIISA